MAGRREQRAADEALVRSIYEEHGRALLTYATRMTDDRVIAEDVVQEALVRAWRNPESLVNGKGSVRGWLLTVVRNVVIDMRRARKARPAEAPELHDGAVVTHDHAEQVVDTIVVMDALDRLSDDHRAVLTQLYFRRRTVSETADELRIPPGTVKSRSYQAIRALRDVMRVHRTEIALGGHPTARIATTSGRCPGPPVSRR